MVFAVEKQAETISSAPSLRPGLIRFDAFQLDLQTHDLKYAGAYVKIDPLALRLLEVLLERPGEVVTRQELFARVWDSRTVSENALAVTMTRLRKTLTDVSGGSDFIATSFRRGYRFKHPVKRCESDVIHIHGEALEAEAARDWSDAIAR
jgi:DNA-binding winged helix-turn-helix (wHTH) protein